MPIEPGDPAPAFTLRDQEGRAHALADYAGRWVVLFFYPKDDTSGCTTEACGFQEALPDFSGLDAAVLGVSILAPKSKAKFAAKNGLSYPLLADDRENAEGKPDPGLARAFGVWKEKSMYGRTFMGVERTTFLIDPEGRVARRWDKPKPASHPAEVLEALRELRGGS